MVSGSYGNWESSWADALFTDNGLGARTSTEFRILNSDGTWTIFKGTGFTWNASGDLTGGTITSMERTQYDGTLMEEISGLNMSGADFSELANMGSSSIGLATDWYWEMRLMADVSFSPTEIVLQHGTGNRTVLTGTGMDPVNGAGTVTSISYTNEDGSVVFKTVNTGGIGLFYAIKALVPLDNWPVYEELTKGDNVITAYGFDHLNLYGGAGNDTIIGSNAWFEILEGGGGDDVMTGNGGQNRYEYADATWGDDTITDFQLGIDKIDFDADTGVTQFSDLVISQNTNGDAVITVAGNPGAGSITLVGISPGSVTSSMFDFGASDTATGTSGDDALVATSSQYNTGEVYGLSGNDTLIGTTWDDEFMGGPGDDVMTGHGGSDEYKFTEGWGHDRITDFDPTHDHLLFAQLPGIDELADLVVTTTTSGILIQTPSGTDSVLLEGLTDPTVLTADNVEFHHDILGTNAAETLEGMKGGDKIQAYGGNDTVLGHNGNDRIFGGKGDDTLFGNAGEDMLHGGDGQDHLYGGIGADHLNGGGGNDVIYGGGGMDILSGNFGADILHGGYDSDTLYGGPDNDTLYGDWQNDELYGGRGQDSLWGGKGHDTLYGGNQADTLHGGSGSDKLYGSNGADTLFGDAHADELYGGNDSDVLYGGNGEDLLAGGAQADTLYGGNDNDLLGGGAGNDTLYGNAQNDELHGGLNDDVLWGGSGYDVLYGDEQNDTLHGGLDADLLYGGTGNDTLYGEEQADTLYGESGHDRLYGGAGNDMLYGGDQNDQLYGGLNNDLLDGGKGSDKLWGGGQHDTFVYRAGYYTDKIMDFQNNIDLIDLTSWGFVDATDALSHATQIGPHVKLDFSSVSGYAGDVLWVYNITASQLANDIIV